MKQSNRLLALLLALFMIFTLAACGGTPDDTTNPDLLEDEESPDAETVGSIMSDLTEIVAERKGENEDTVGWLYVPGLPIDEVVVFNSESNKYYERLDFYKEYNFNGIFYADRRTEFGEFTSETLGSNLCIYGHALTDEVDHPNYEIKFGPLHDLRNEEIAKEVPYILFSTEEENMAFEIFAVFYVNADNLEFPYNRGDLSQEEYYDLVVNHALPRSIYNYEDVELSAEDKFITLSTCIYSLPDENDYLPYEGATPTNYPNTYYRYVVMGKLVDPESPLKTEANLSVNEGFLADPDGKISSQ